MKNFFDLVIKANAFGSKLLVLFNLTAEGYSFFHDLFGKKKTAADRESVFIIVPGHDAMGDCGAVNIKKGEITPSGIMYETGAITAVIGYLSKAYYALTSSDANRKIQMIFLNNWSKSKIYRFLSQNSFRSCLSEATVEVKNLYLIQVHFDIASTTYEKTNPLKRINKHIIYYRSPKGEHLAKYLVTRLSNKNRDVMALSDTESRFGRLGFIADTQDVALVVECGYLNSSESSVIKWSDDLTNAFNNYDPNA